MDYSVTTPEVLRKLCIDNNWFSSGDNEQYHRLFYANENGFSIGEIATIIWVCSDINVRSWNDVFHLLCVENEKYYSSLELDSVRR